MLKALDKLISRVRAFEDKQRREEIRFGKIFMGYVLIPVSLGFCVLAFNAWEQSTWLQTTGVVKKTRIEEPIHKNGYFSLLLTYSYRIDEKDFIGNGPIAHDLKSENLKGRMESDYPIGSNIQISYNPKAISESCLAQNAKGIPVFFLIIAFFLSFLSYKLIKSPVVENQVATENY